MRSPNGYALTRTKQQDVQQAAKNCKLPLLLRVCFFELTHFFFSTGRSHTPATAGGGIGRALWQATSNEHYRAHSDHFDPLGRHRFPERRMLGCRSPVPCPSRQRRCLCDPPRVQLGFHKLGFRKPGLVLVNSTELAPVSKQSAALKDPMTRVFCI